MSRSRTAVAAALLIALVSVIGTACSASKKSTSSSAPSSDATTPAPGATSGAITIKSFAFKPDPITVKAGDRVTVANTDDTAHTVTANDKSFDTRSIGGGQSATFAAPTAPGTYRYHCNIHNYMTGTLVVR